MEPITDADAEAMLLALGAMLEWEDDGTFAFTPDASGSYQVQYDVKQGQWRATHNWQLPGTLCVSVASARGACEGHYATGTWDVERLAEADRGE